MQISAAILAVQSRAEEELLRAREELAAASAWQRTILDSADVSIIATDPNGVIQTFNRTAERMLGYRAEELVGKTTPAIIHDPEEVQHRAAELTRELGRTIEPGFEVFVAKTRAAAPEEREWTYRSKSGERFPVRLTVTAMFDVAGRITGFMGVATDLSERKREEERFRTVVEAVPNGIVVVNQAGTITLVNAATEKKFGYERTELIGQPIELLVPERFHASHTGQRRSFLADPQTRAMGTGRDLVGRRKDSSEFPLEIGLSPIDSREGLLVLAAVVDVSARKREEAALRAALARALDMVAPLAQAKGLALDQDIAPEVGELVGDERRFRQVVVNLLTNAVKFSESDRVRLAADLGDSADRPALRVRVTDSGIGIAAADLERVFMPFQQLDSGLARMQEGTGVGLSICQRVVRLLGGDISVRSEPGRGSAFEFWLPLAGGKDHEVQAGNAS
ncbi:MAG: PAS domain-containing sensor histidine kinase [Acidobacteriota bacterium]